MKMLDRENARDMRVGGASVGEIARRLGVSKSSVSVWVRDVRMTQGQMDVLNKNRGAFHLMASKAMSEKCANLRMGFREDGRRRALLKDWLHVAGCMLYWGEGSKTRNAVRLCNGDMQLMGLFVRFLRESLAVRDDEISVNIVCYDNNGLKVEDVQRRWLGVLNLSEKCIRQVRVNPDKRRTSGKKIGKLPYGVAEVVVCRTDLAQHISGAIAGYAGVETTQWAE